MSEFLDGPHLTSVGLVLLDPLVCFCIFLCHFPPRIVSISWWNQGVEGPGDTVIATKCLKSTRKIRLVSNSIAD